MYVPPKIKNMILEYDFNSWLNRALTKSDKDKLCKDLNLPSYSDDYCKWNTLKLYLEEINFEVKDTKRLINGKQRRVSILKKKKS